MKHIGIVGGLSPESTVEYLAYIYDSLGMYSGDVLEYLDECKNYNKKKGGWSYPEKVFFFPDINTTVCSLNLQEIADLFMSDRWDDMSDKIVDSISYLERRGADFAAIATNTPHNGFERISKYSPLEVLSIMDATAKEIKLDGLKRVGLLGTKQTMEYGFFQRSFSEYGLDAFIPELEDRSYIDKVIWDELVKGKVTEESRYGYKEVIGRLQQRGAEGVILGCTEIPLLIKESDTLVKTYDTTRLHARAILDYALK